MKFNLKVIWVLFLAWFHGKYLAMFHYHAFEFSLFYLLISCTRHWFSIHFASEKNMMENYEPVISYVFISIKREQSGTESTKNDKKYVVTNGNDSTLSCSRFRGKTFQFKSHKTFSFFKWRLKIHFQSVSRSSFHVDVKEAFFGAEGGKKMNERMLRTIMKSFFSYAFKCDE